MKGILLGGLLGGFLVAAAPVLAADVGISINVGQPGFFGQINIGAVPQPPQLVYVRPMVIHRDPAYRGAPIYLHVRPGYEKHWARHCAEYDACGRPVYFVRDDWYNREYVPHYQHHGDEDRRGDDQGHGHGHGHDEDHGHDHGHGQDEDHGHGHEGDHDNGHDH